MAIQRHTILTYSDPGVGKSTLMLSVVRYVAREFKKKTRVVISDYQTGGGVLDLLNPQIAEVWHLSRRKFPLEAMQQAALGFWPEDPEDPLSKLIPPTKETWETIGGYVFDGLTGNAALAMAKYSDLAVQGIKLGQDPAVTYKDGDVKFGGNSPAHYGEAQRLVLRLCSFYKELGLNGKESFPMIVYCTALEQKAEDPDTTAKTYMIGPTVVGKAATAQVQRNFECVFNLTTTNTGERRLYLHDWFQGNDPIPHKARASLPALVYNGKPDYLVIPQPVPRDRHWGIGEYLELLEKMQGEAKGIVV